MAVNAAMKSSGGRAEMHQNDAAWVDLWLSRALIVDVLLGVHGLRAGESRPSTRVPRRGERRIVPFCPPQRSAEQAAARPVR